MNGASNSGGGTPAAAPSLGGTSLMDPNLLIQKMNTSTKHDRKRCYSEIRQLIGRIAFDPASPGKKTSQTRLIVELLDHAGRTKRWSGSKLTRAAHLALSALLELMRKEPAIYSEFDSNNISIEDLHRAHLELHLRIRGTHGYTPEQLTALEFLLFLTQFAPNYEYRRFVKSEWNDIDTFFVNKGPVPIARCPPKLSVQHASSTPAQQPPQAVAREITNPMLQLLLQHGGKERNSTPPPQTPIQTPQRHPSMMQYDQSSLYMHYPALELVQLVVNRDTQQGGPSASLSQPSTSWWH